VAAKLVSLVHMEDPNLGNTLGKSFLFNTNFLNIRKFRGFDLFYLQNNISDILFH
jgi:hypothetical protein